MTGESPWIAVGELAHGFEEGSFSPSPSSALAGRSVALHWEDGRVLQLTFLDDRRLETRVVSGPGEGQRSAHEYVALHLREDLYFVDYVKTGERATCVTLILDLAQGICTQLTGRLPKQTEAERSLSSRLTGGRLELTGVEAAFSSGAIDRTFDASTKRHPPTEELIGKRVEYTYSPSERYEHLYLNQHFYTWHCLQGVERGLADTDRCHYVKLADLLYLFVWREKLVPTLGVVVLDYRDWTSRGKIFGYEGGDYTRLTNFVVGAKARLVNEVRRPGEDEAATISGGGAR